MIKLTGKKKVIDVSDAILSPMVEDLTKSRYAADLLLSDLRAAYGRSDLLTGILVFDLITQAAAIKTRLDYILLAVGKEAE